MKIALALATALLSLPALAAPPAGTADVPAVDVHYADLDLDRQAGIVTLYQRIKGAARQVCAEHGGRRLSEQRSQATCVELAVSTAVARMNRPMLSEYYAQQTGKAPADSPTRVAGR
jgi:UrcA family protein